MATPRRRRGLLATIRQEIANWLHRTQPQGKGGGFAALEEAQAGDTGAENEDGDFDVGPEATQRLLEEDPSGALLAVVKKGLKDNKSGGKGGGKRGDKGGKGGGKGEKGGGKKGGPRACFECGAEDHLANACPVRLERVAAGGPERLPKDDAMKGDKKGGGGKGDKEAWKGYGAKGYTFIPSAGQWRAAAGSPGVPLPGPRQWAHPLQPGGGKGFAWCQQQPAGYMLSMCREVERRSPSSLPAECSSLLALHPRVEGWQRQPAQKRGDRTQAGTAPKKN